MVSRLCVRRASHYDDQLRIAFRSKLYGDNGHLKLYLAFQHCGSSSLERIALQQPANPATRPASPGALAGQSSPCCRSSMALQRILGIHRALEPTNGRAASRIYANLGTSLAYFHQYFSSHSPSAQYRGSSSPIATPAAWPLPPQAACCSRMALL